jgi:hypothetical protein
MGKGKLLLLVVLAAFFAASTVFAAEHEFKAKLTPKEEKAKPDSKASGKAEFKLDKEEQHLKYKLDAKNIKDVTGAHIHLGKKGDDGPPVAFLFKGKKSGKFSGTLAEGTLSGDDLMGDFKGKMSELAAVIRAGGTYVNVHTDANPSGEVRGQIEHD